MNRVEVKDSRFQGTEKPTTWLFGSGGIDNQPYLLQMKSGD